MVFLLYLVLPVSCIDKLDFVGETKEGQLVIYGLFTDINERQVVNVSQTTATGLAPKGIPNAQVYLLNSREERVARYNSVGNGDYEIFGIKANEGERYAIEVTLGDNLYRSKLEKVPELQAEDQLSFDFVKEPFRTEAPESVFTVYSETMLPTTQDPIYLRWTVEETYIWPLVYLPGTGFPPPVPPPCFISDVIEPNRLNLFDGSGTSTRRTKLVLAKRKVDNSFLYPFFVSVKQLSINREAYEYWEKIKIVINNQGSLFDIPPAPVFGNIANVEDPNETVLGYFEVAKTKVTRIYTTRADVPFYLVDPCQFFPNKPDDSYASECKSCDARAQGRRWTNNAPDWWKFD
ncbi:DUF4249 domain-containing protein [Aquiflexum sp. LQ15W]|uniref:DUF4249 family protein n=1 Tax=Cognataquiflexum nitidum TaxID=2922272 RepID=UPI001F13988D|nr:DUF4249 family protein [Cognataquiflexum nitidum]MCH6197962.1 DUF4249 domain-containing protein [Cognataquiflexum nitidum]